MIAYLRAAIAQRPSTEWLLMFRDAGVPAALMGTLDDLLTDPQLAANGMTITANDTIVGATRVINHPVNVSELPRRAIGPAPALGEHSAEILHALGYTTTQIAELRDQRVV